MYKTVRISDFLHRRKDAVGLIPNAEYSLVTVKLHHKGVVLREKKLGSQISSTMFKIRKGQFILSGIDARNGAFGIIPDSLEGAIITNDFWCFDVDESVMKRDFFYWLTNTPLFLSACIKSSKGETQRVRLQKELFLGFEFRIPPVEDQEEFLQRIEKTDFELAALNQELTCQSEKLALFRQAILQEAIEGELTAEWRKQNSKFTNGENHADHLLEKIKIERRRLIDEGFIRKEKPLPLLSEEDKPFILPRGWVWCRLGEISNFIDYRGKTPTKIKSGVRLITAKNVRMGNLSLSPEEFISKSEYETRMTRGFPKKDDIFFTTEAPLGNVCLNPFDNEISMGQRIITIQPILIKPKFLMYQLMSKPIQNEIHSRKSGITAKGIKSSKLALIPIAVPPIHEQIAIIERVENLAAQIGVLERQVSERNGFSEFLMQAVLRETFEHSYA